MNNNKDITINLFDVYERSISSRSSISMLLDRYKNDSNLTLRFNFNQIAFISRSAAQQLILEKKELEKMKINIIFSNLESQINQMMELAAHKLDRKKINVTQKTFANAEELNEFLLSF